MISFSKLNVRLVVSKDRYYELTLNGNDCIYHVHKLKLQVVALQETVIL